MACNAIFDYGPGVVGMVPRFDPAQRRIRTAGYTGREIPALEDRMVFADVLQRIGLRPIMLTNDQYFQCAIS